MEERMVTKFSPWLVKKVVICKMRIQCRQNANGMSWQRSTVLVQSFNPNSSNTSECNLHITESCTFVNMPNCLKKNSSRSSHTLYVPNCSILDKWEATEGLCLSILRLLIFSHQSLCGMCSLVVKSTEEPRVCRANLIESHKWCSIFGFLPV